jgi:hypothetical protein
MDGTCLVIPGGPTIRCQPSYRVGVRAVNRSASPRRGTPNQGSTWNLDSSRRRNTPVTASMAGFPQDAWHRAPDTPQVQPPGRSQRRGPPRRRAGGEGVQEPRSELGPQLCHRDLRAISSRSAWPPATQWPTGSSSGYASRPIRSPRGGGVPPEPAQWSGRSPSGEPRLPGPVLGERRNPVCLSF